MTDKSKAEKAKEVTLNLLNNFWHNTRQYAPWTLGVSLVLVGGIVGATVLAPKLAALAVTLGIAGKTAGLLGYVNLAATYLTQAVQTAFNLFVMLQGQIFLGLAAVLIPVAGQLGAVATMAAGSLLAFIETAFVTTLATATAVTLGGPTRSAYNFVKSKFSGNEATSTGGSENPESRPSRRAPSSQSSSSSSTSSSSSVSSLTSVSSTENKAPDTLPKRPLLN